MEKKKIFLVVSISILIILGSVYFIIKNNQSSQSSSSISVDVCTYLSDIPPYDCDKAECNIKSEDDNYWNIFYRCPGPEHFPLGQGYDLKVDKNTKKIEIIGLTN